MGRGLGGNRDSRGCRVIYTRSFFDREKMKGWIMRTKHITMSIAEASRAHTRDDALFLAYASQQPPFLSGNARLVKFNSRAGLEAISKKTGIRPVVKTQVPMNCAVWAFETDSEARKAAGN
jgi:hypothetical protein